MTNVSIMRDQIWFKLSNFPDDTFGDVYIAPTDSPYYSLCSKYGFCIIIPEGIIDLRLIIMLLVRLSWADVLSVMLARGVMCDVSYPRQERVL